MLFAWLKVCMRSRRRDMYFIGDKEIGEGWESITCPYADGFSVIWEVGVETDPMIKFCDHMAKIHNVYIERLSRWKI